VVGRQARCSCSQQYCIFASDQPISQLLKPASQSNGFECPGRTVEVEVELVTVLDVDVVVLLVEVVCVLVEVIVLEVVVVEVDDVRVDVVEVVAVSVSVAVVVAQPRPWLTQHQFWRSTDQLSKLASAQSKGTEVERSVPAHPSPCFAQHHTFFASVQFASILSSASMQ